MAKKQSVDPVADNVPVDEPPPAEAVTHEAPEHGTVVNYALPGVISMTVPFGIHPETHQQIALDDDEAVTAEPRIQPVKAAASKKVVAPASKGVETA